MTAAQVSVLAERLAALEARVAAGLDRGDRLEGKVDCLDRKLGELKVQLAEARAGWRVGIRVAAISGSVVGALIAALARAWGLP